MILHHAHLAVAAGGVDAFHHRARSCAVSRQVRASASDLSVRRRARRARGRRPQSSSARTRRSLTAPTGRNISATSHRTAAATSTSISIRSGPHPTSMPSASTPTGRSPTGATAARISTAQAGIALARTISPICKSNIARRRGLRLVLRQRRRSRRADSARRSPTALGKPWVFRFKDIRSWWANAHYDRPGGAESADADRVGAAIQADLVHRDRLSGDRQGRQPAQRLRRSQKLRERTSRTTPTARAMT